MDVFFFKNESCVSDNYITYRNRPSISILISYFFDKVTLNTRFDVPSGAEFVPRGYCNAIVLRK